MATISAAYDDTDEGNYYDYVWSPITEADTAETVYVKRGKYTANVEGTFGGGTIEFKFGLASGNEASIDATNLTFSANGSYNIDIPDGYVLPVRTGGSSMSVTATITPREL